MSDEDDLEDIRCYMREATPRPDPETKAVHFALAQKNFARHQETLKAARLNSERPKKGLIKGVWTMLAHIGTRGALTASTALVALGLVIALPQLSQIGAPSQRPTPEQSTPIITPSDEEVIAESDALNENAPAPKTALSPPPQPESAPRETRDEAVASGADMAMRKRAAKPQALSGLAASNSGIAAAPATTALHQNDYFPRPPQPNTESYANAEQNPLKITAEGPVSTFSIDVDTASYAVIRSSITRGLLPPKEAVRIEEMINYFPYDYPAPTAGEAPFKPTVTVMPTPWNSGTELVHIAIQGRTAQTETRPPLNLVFLIDTSGSMNSANKLPLLKQSLALMLPQLSARDQVSIVTYAGSAGEVLAPTPASDRQTILNALNNLAAGGSTAGQAGLQQAYDVAEGMAEKGEVTRVILATDGDFNVGLSDPEKLKEFIAQKRQSGTYLSVMGFGRGNLDDATMQALAQNGNGQASYIDTLSEAQKVLVDQFASAQFPIADDVKIQVEFNPATVSEYRLIGYETRALAREDFNNDKVDAGDIGAGTSVTALYEITPKGSAARLSDPLRYGATGEVDDKADELGFLKLRYKTPGAAQSQLIETPIRPETTAASDDARFAVAIASFGELLRQSKFLKDWHYDDAIALATANEGADLFGYRVEAVRLMRLAKSLSAK
ncbi:von Willebrand factor type A domain-containing protein [Aquicoccus sp. G2-2]|uniref:vWA domain-containing protein n=1 Tax=Aquicoccus sp. G2-2 TaxID=3092120 RepID=UPI002ADF955C|nr:von Willebrand factor type A domain-containing protein [Aquicoccus sp. G2-2]MEA1114482.1 von Willebrand factor type A domain-containing protein [Aquicoccus sp. G2-2]